MTHVLIKNNLTHYSFLNFIACVPSESFATFSHGKSDFKLYPFECSVNDYTFSHHSTKDQMTLKESSVIGLEYTLVFGMDKVNSNGKMRLCTIRQSTSRMRRIQ